MKFMKKPVVIEATQWFKMGDHPKVFMGQLSDRPRIDTLEGPMFVDVGDWIITGVKGEHYPCKPDIFEATYEPVNENTAHFEAYGLMGGDEFVSGYGVKRNILGDS